MKGPGIGSSPRRREDHRLVTGAGTFGDDFALPAAHAWYAVSKSETNVSRDQPQVGMRWASAVFARSLLP